MAKARDVPGLHAGTRFGDAAAAAVDTRTREVFAQAGGVLDIGDIEPVHAMRVATRRLRAALEVFAGCFDQAEHTRLLKEVKRLADALGERRDPDVAIGSLGAFAESLAPTDRGGVKDLIEQLKVEQATANGTLGAALVRVREIELERRLLELAATAEAPGS